MSARSAAGEFEVSMRLESGEHGVVVGPTLGTGYAAGASSEARSGPARVPLVVVTPQLLRMPDVREADREALTIGTEEVIDLGWPAVRSASRATAPESGTP